MLRRLFLGLIALIVMAIATVLIWGPAYVERERNPVIAPEGGWPVSDAARALHQRMTIADWHSDALLWDRNLLRRVNRGHVDIPRLVEGNVAVQVFTAVTKSPAGQNYDENSTDAFDNITPLVIGQLRPPKTWNSLFERALDQAGRLRAMAEQAPDRLRIIYNRDDLEAVLAARAKGDALTGGVIGAEGGHPLEGDLANLDRMYEAGYRVIGLTHFFDNELGGSLHGTANSGLSPFGRQVIERMMERHMIVDLAHASPQMVSDVLDIEGLRPILSHTGIRSHCNTPRNIPDGLMKAIAAKGGMIGLGYWQDVTCAEGPAAVAASIKAAVDLVGADHVSLGSDYDGSVDAPFDAAHLSALTQALMDVGLDETSIAKVMGGNQIAFLREMLPPA